MNVQTKRILEGFLEIVPIDGNKQAALVSIHERLETIKTVWTFYQEVREDPMFLKAIFTTGRFLLFQRSRDNFLSRIRVVPTVDVNDRRTSWIMGHPMAPPLIGRVFGDEAREMANMMVDGGFAVYSRQAEHPVRTFLRRGLDMYKHARLVIRFK